MASFAAFATPTSASRALAWTLALLVALTGVACADETDDTTPIVFPDTEPPTDIEDVPEPEDTPSDQSSGDAGPDAEEDAEEDADAAEPDAEETDADDAETPDDGGSPFDCAELGEPCSPDLVGETRCAEGATDLVQECKSVNDCTVWIDDTFCESLNLCTNVPDVCVEGACVPDGDPNAGCGESGDPCTSLECDPGTGECAEVSAGQDAPCDDGDVCTVGDACFDGQCLGTYECPKDCNINSNALAFGEAAVVKLNQGTTSDVINAYGCGDMKPDYAGHEQTFQLKAPLVDCGEFTDAETGITYEAAVRIHVEIMDPADWGEEFVDIFVLGDESLCDPSDCKHFGLMDDTGRAEVAVPMGAGDDDLFVLIDGRDNYVGDVRIATSCLPVYPIEEYCGDGVAGIFDVFGADCVDPSCEDTQLCQYESLHCNDDIDNDSNGQTDCEDSACSSEPQCESATSCPGTTPLACGDVLTGQAVEDGDTFLSSMDFTCPDAGVPDNGGDYKALQQVYELQTAGEDCYEVTVTADGSGLFDYMLTPFCDEGTGCFAGAGLFANTGEALSVNNGQQGFLVVNEWTFTDDTYSVALTCGCD